MGAIDAATTNVNAAEDIVWHKTELGPEFFLSTISWPTTPGTFVKVPAHKQHNLTNTGGDDLVFLVIYDHPHIDGTP